MRFESGHEGAQAPGVYILEEARALIRLHAYNPTFISMIDDHINNKKEGLARTSLIKDERLFDKFDIVFGQYFKSIESLELDDVLKFQGFTPAKKNVIGQWWEGARAYLLKPAGAGKLVQWVKQNGAIPADWALNASILDVKFDKGNQVSFSQKRFSFTKDLK